MIIIYTSNLHCKEIKNSPSHVRCKKGFKGLTTAHWLKSNGTYSIWGLRNPNCTVLFFLMWPNVGYGLPIHEISRSHITLHHNQYDSSEQVISSSQRLLPDNTHNRQTSMPPVGYEPPISPNKCPQTYALDHTATGTSTAP
jgi:hypothetical protein